MEFSSIQKFTTNGVCKINATPTSRKVLKHVIFAIFWKRRNEHIGDNFAGSFSSASTPPTAIFFQNFAKIPSKISWQFRHTFVLLYDHYKIQRDHCNFSVLVIFFRFSQKIKNAHFCWILTPPLTSFLITKK